MRWVFRDPNDREENAARSAVIGRIDAWWGAFSENVENLRDLFSRRGDFALVDFMQSNLSAIEPQLMWEYGPALKGEGHRLIISPEDNWHLRPLTEEILARAPAMKGWEFYPARVAESLTLVQPNFDGRLGISAEGMLFRVHPDELGRVETEFIVPSASDEDQAAGAAFLALETLLGEEVRARWIGGITGSPSGSGDDWRPLGELIDAVSVCIDHQRENQLPGPFLESTGDGKLTWKLLEADPEDSADYSRREDILLPRRQYCPPGRPTSTACTSSRTASSGRMSVSFI